MAPQPALPARILTAVLLAAGALALSGSAVAARATDAPGLGPNVTILDPSMSTAQIESVFDAIAAQQVPNQFGDERYAILFRPGTYGTPADPINVQVGYYTEVAGLGASPRDVVVNGTIDVYNQCFGPGDCTALVNFWRSLSNLSIRVAGKGGCQFGEFWAASQAAPMRRVHVDGHTTLMDYCSSPAFASGGFIADSLFTNSTIVNGSQQQYLVRNSSISGWSNGVWNQVFAGVQGAPAQSFPSPPYTTLATTPLARERPFLHLDDRGRWNVFVPTVRRDSAGPSWVDGQTPGESVPLRRFFVAKPGDSAKRLNNALAHGQHLLLTPGVYHVDETIRVKGADKVVLGLGLATIVPDGGVVPMTVEAPGAVVAGVIFDAGPVNSPVLLRVGPDRRGADASDQPTTLNDVFFRIGGPHLGKATLSLEVASDGVVLDHIWAWRADHGDGVGWTSNTADTGVRVTGDDVLATGLFAEHYQRYNVVWEGERGRTIMFQNELPYDPPNQAAYQHDGVLGWAAYKVGDNVRTHEGWGLGSYCFFNVDPTIHVSRAFEVPVTPGVRLHDILTLSITNHGTIDHVVNDVGAATDANTTPVNIVSYP
jgi:hypothetical protein